MSNKNGEKRIISSKDRKYVNRKVLNKSPFKKDKTGYNISINKYDVNTDTPTVEDNNIQDNNTDNYYNEITEEKIKFFSPNINKKEYLEKLNNNMKTYGFTDSSYVFQSKKDNLSSLNDSNLLNDNYNVSRNTNNVIKNNVMKINSNKKLKSPKVINKNIKGKSLNNNIIPNNNNTNSNNSLNDNINFDTEPFDSKYSFRINKIKDDYIDFLQKEFEDNTKKSVKLDSNNKELLKKCDDLIHDNRILSNTLNDRTSKLNKVIQENLMVKTELDKSLLVNQKNEQKLEYYEEQFNLFKSSNENYQKIINELKEQNEQLNLKIIEIQKTNDENIKKNEENFNNQLKEEIQNTKTEMEELYNKKIAEEQEKNDQKTQEFQGEIKDLQDKNRDLSSELTKKEGMLDLACKENEKLTNENSLFRTQLDQYSRQINELNTIIKHKDNIINNLKQENINNEKFLNKSSSCSMVKFDGSEYINENILKLISDNEENKMKIELLNDKLKSIDEIERKYNEIMNGNRGLTLSEKLAFHMDSNSPKNTSSNLKYNNNIYEAKNSTFQKKSVNKSYNKNFVSPKKLQLQASGFNDAISPIINININRNKNDYIKLNKDLSPKTKNNNNVIIYTSNITRDNKRKKLTNSTIKENENDKEKNKNNDDKEIKLIKRGYKAFEKEIEKEKEKEKNEISTSTNNSVISRTRKIEQKTTPIKGRFFNKNLEENETNEKKVQHGKELESEKDEIKNSIRIMNRKKNYTHKPKNLNYSLDEIEQEQKNNGEQIEASGRLHTDRGEGDKKNEKKDNCYLYGIDRIDYLHIFVMVFV